VDVHIRHSSRSPIRRGATAGWFLVVVTCFVLSLTPACSGSGGTESIVVYTPHGKELLRAYKNDFEALHPEIRVQWLDMGAQQIYDRISTESARPQASLWWGGPHVVFNKAADQGLLEAYEPSWSAASPDGKHHPSHFWYGTYVTPEVITYNTRLLDASEAPSDWDDLVDPRWRDRIIIRYPLASGTMRTIFAAMILRQKTVEQGYAWLARLDANTSTYTADPTQLYIKLAREEGQVTVWNMPDTDIQRRQYDYPFGYIIPESGTPVLTEGIALVRGGPNLEAARLFYEFVTSKEAILRQSHEFHRIPARTDIPEDQLPDWIRDVEIREMELDWDSLASAGRQWMLFWDEHIKGRGSDYLRDLGLPSETPVRANP
jgi:iron(III) transport system substrate-binding protein